MFSVESDLTRLRESGFMESVWGRTPSTKTSLAGSFILVFEVALVNVALVL